MYKIFSILHVLYIKTLVLYIKTQFGLHKSELLCKPLFENEGDFRMITYQDYEAWGKADVPLFIAQLINDHKSSDLYKIAKDADEYDAQRNVTITNYVQTIWSSSGAPIEDFTAANNRIASNFFHRLNKQRATYSLGNGISFVNDTGDKIKAQLGVKFDKRMKDAGFFACIHGLSFVFWNMGEIHVFKVTEFAPLWDETNGTLRAGVRFWQISRNKPVIAVFYEIDGYTRFTTAKEQEVVDSDGQRRIYYTDGINFHEDVKKRGYKQVVNHTEADGDMIVGEENYSGFPIIPLWGSNLHQSTLVGMREAIDSFDLIRSGFANDLSDCTQIYWLIENCAGMTDEDLQRFRDKLKIQRIAEVGTGEDGAKVTPYTQEIPFAARQAYLDDIRKGIYEDFGALDVHQVSANSTNDHLAAAYQPMDENADDFEYQISDAVQQLLVVAGLGEHEPQYKRNMIANQREQVDMVMAEAEYLDEQTILEKLPNITVDEVEEILKRRGVEDLERMRTTPNSGNENEESEAEEESEA